MHNTPRYDPPFELPTKEYYQLIHTLTARLPPPLADTPQALVIRDQAALAQVVALVPVNANEVGLATQCIAARAQAEDVLRQIRKHDGDDIRIIIKLNAQYVAMVRTSLGAHGHLLRAQAVRHKREANPAALKADEWTQHIAASAMQQALDAGPPQPMPAVEPSAPAAEPSVAAAEAPAPAAEPPARVASAPAPVLTPALPPAPAVAPALPPASFAAGLPAPAAPAQAPPPRSRRMAAPVEPDELPRDLPSEADRYAVIYPRRAREIRHYGGLPPNCTFGPPDDELVRAIVTGTTPVLRDLDGPNAAAAD
jgi:hypothetical protein